MTPLLLKGTCIPLTANEGSGAAQSAHTKGRANDSAHATESFRAGVEALIGSTEDVETTERLAHGGLLPQADSEDAMPASRSIAHLAIHGSGNEQAREA